MRSKLLARWAACFRDACPGSRAVQPPASTANPPAAAATGLRISPRAQLGVGSRSSIGLNVYNDQNEKLGDISEILLDKSGKVDGVVIGVGGFLGMGQHDIMVELDKLKFVDEPVRTSATGDTTTDGCGQSSGQSLQPPPPPAPRLEMDPDHAILSGVTKDQLKSMPQFKFD